MVQSLGTEWGLVRHYWIVAQLSLTLPATLILMLQVPSVSRMARIAVDSALAAGDFSELRMQLVVHAVGGLLVLLTITAPSVYKPWGKIGSAEGPRGGRWVQHEGSPASATCSPTATALGPWSFNCHAAS